MQVKYFKATTIEELENLLNDFLVKVGRVEEVAFGGLEAWVVYDAKPKTFDELDLLPGKNKDVPKPE